MSLFEIPTLGQYDPEIARRKRDEGIAEAEGGADVVFIHAARNAVRQAADIYQDFTTDDLEPLCTITPKNGKAWGGVMLWAKGQGLVESTNTTRKSKRVSNHARPLAVWRSLVCKVGVE